MRLFAQVGPDGSLEGLIAVSDGEVTAMPIPEPGNQIYEVTEHELDTNTFEPQALAEMRDMYSVEVQRATARLRPREAQG
jgi:hypothetical protein